MRRVWAAFAACFLKRHNVFHGGSFCSHGQESYRLLTRVARRQLPPPHISRCFTAPRQKSRTAFVSPLILAVPSLRSLRLLPGVPRRRKATPSNARTQCGHCTPLPAAPLPLGKMRSFGLLLVYAPAENHGFSPGGPRYRPTRKIIDFSRGDSDFAALKTIALLSDFCAAYGRLSPPVS